MALRRLWTAKPLLVAYVLAIGFTLGLLVDRAPSARQALPVVAGRPPERTAAATAAERETPQPALWHQLFRPSPATARWLLRMGLSVLRVADGSARQAELRHLKVYWTGSSGDQPQTFFQTMLPFLRPDNNTAKAPPPAQPGAPTPDPGAAPSPPGNSQPNPAAPTPSEQPPPGAVPIGGGLPLVGVYHTHDWESYISEFPALKVRHERDLNTIQSLDHTKRSIMDVGKTFSIRLSELGVTTVYADYTHQDLPYNYAYQSSRDTAKKLLKEHPTVKILLDLHRDSGYNMDYTAVVDGKKAAQVRCIIGSRNAQWEQNRAYCDKLMQGLEAKHPGMSLPTRIQNDNYNQDLMPGAILLEIGGAMNQFAEAERSAVYLAEALSDLVRDGVYPR